MDFSASSLMTLVKNPLHVHYPRQIAPNTGEEAIMYAKACYCQLQCFRLTLWSTRAGGPHNAGFVVWVGGILSAELFDCFGRNNPGTSRLSPGFPPPGFPPSAV